MRQWVKSGFRGGKGMAPTKQSQLIAKETSVIKVVYETKGLWASTLKVSDNLFYEDIQIPAIGQHLEPGEPSIPQEGLYVAIPEEATILNIRVAKTKKKTIQLTHKLKPAPEPTKDPESKPAINPKQEIYGKDAVFPGILFKNLGLKHIGDINVVHIMIFPVQYYPSSNKIDFYRKIELEIEYEIGTPKAPLRGLPERARKRIPPGYDDQILNLDNI
ncbi:MAG: C25 family peptidase propeptide domain-containing protein [Candidatus Helarchaeota archaeon]